MTTPNAELKGQSRNCSLTQMRSYGRSNIPNSVETCLFDHGVETAVPDQTDLAGVVVDDEALVPAVEVLVRVDLDAQLLQHGLVGPLAHGVHGGAHVVQDAHDARRILGSRGNISFKNQPTRDAPGWK